MIASDTALNVEFFERVKQRRDAIKSLILTTFAPVFLLPIVILLATLWAVRKSMQSLKSVSQTVSQRSVDNLQRLPRDNQPAELLPVIDSVNGLLAGIERGITREKQFTDDAAHELRTPITSIKMLEQLLRRENADPALISYLDNLRDSVDQSNNLIEQLLIFARIQTTQTTEREPLDLLDEIHTQLGLLSPQITEKSLAIEISPENQTTLINANRPALSLLLSNILTNAIKFSDDKDTVYIIITSHSLRIEDNGPGILPTDQLRIFDRFFRSASTRHTQGSGLGLALAKWVVDTHGFRLSIEPPLKGEGACFLLLF